MPASAALAVAGTLPSGVLYAPRHPQSPHFRSDRRCCKRWGGSLSLRSIFRLQNVYMDAEAVDDALVDMLFDPSNDVGALDAFVSIITGLALPLLLHWQFSACLL